MITETSKPIHILVVDDDQGARESLEEILEDDYDVVCVADGGSALERIKKEAFDLVLLDLMMPKMDGIATLQRLKTFDRNLDVIMISATDRAQEAARSIKTGAYDYITKPFDADTILNVIERAIQKRSLQKEVLYLRSEVANISESNPIIGKAASMQTVFSMIDRVAGTSSNVLITGESGTGKELVAREIHQKSQRAAKPFVAINCAAIPSELLESELFGHEKGSFTGAYSQGTGKFEYAHGGTLFLDEISSMRIELQAKLLRFLQEREFTRVGGHRVIKVDIRMIAATNVALEDLVQTNSFREDLYFRLNVIPIEIPPLRRRRGDVPLLADFFLKRFNRQLNQKIEGFTPAAMRILEDYHWPGNIRELENLVERLVVLRADENWIDEKDLPFELLFSEQVEKVGQKSDAGLIRARQTFERQYILRALRKCQGNQSEAARILKIHRNTMIQKIKSLGIQVDNIR